jgi:tRNA U38,U39,U40 pseudouridine synthase TruA
MAICICENCSGTFNSRNALFRHLDETGCGGETVKRVDRFVVLYGYIGSHFYGSQKNAASDEDKFPTAEGALVRAVERATLNALGAAAATADVHSRASRTDRGVHALANCVYLRVSAEYPARPAAFDEATWIQAVHCELPPSVVVVRCFQLRDADFDARRACQKRLYAYYVPYEALMTAQELAEAAEERRNGGWFARGDVASREVWVSGLPDDCTAQELRTFAEAQLGHASEPADEPRGFSPIEAVTLFDWPGSAVLRMTDPTWAEALCRSLDGARGLPVRAHCPPIQSRHTRVCACARACTHTRIHNMHCVGALHDGRDHKRKPECTRPRCLVPPKGQSIIACRGLGTFDPRSSDGHLAADEERGSRTAGGRRCAHPSRASAAPARVVTIDGQKAPRICF